MLLTLARVASAAQETQDSGLPSLDFLEFLGSFETDSGQWIDPVDLMQPDFAQLLESVDKLPSQTTDIHDQENNSQADDSDTEDEI